MRNFYFTNEAVGIEELITLPLEEARHFAVVLRGKIGEKIRLLNGKGIVAIGEITEITGTNKNLKVEVKIESYEDNFEPQKQLCLFVACPRTKQIELIIRQCVEFGVSEIHPIITDWTISRPEKNAEKWDDILIEAMKQSGNPFLPKIFPICSFAEALQKNAPLIGYFGAVPEKNGEKKYFWPFELQIQKRIAYFVGPEGGFSPHEIEFFKSAQGQINGQNFKKFIPLTIGKNILRMETAVIAGVALLTSDFLPKFEPNNC